MPTREFKQFEWNDLLAADARQLAQMSVREDLGRGFDWTTVMLVPESAAGSASIVARSAGVVAGLLAAEIILREYDPFAAWTPHAKDGDTVVKGTTLVTIEAKARTLLTGERPILNLLGHLSGIATLTREYVEAVKHTRAKILDTRKTMPGWRRLEKYAVRMGGGCNHRGGLFDAILIKDNHLVFGADAGQQAGYSPSQAVKKARDFLRTASQKELDVNMPVEIEVDSLAQLREVLPALPDIVLLDNMTLDQLEEAVAIRDSMQPGVILEASGGVNLQTVRGIAESGVDRISVGALTHSACWWDVGMDW